MSALKTLVFVPNRCPCGWLGSHLKPCQCSAAEVQRYLAKISGPLMDRIDLHLQVPALKTKELLIPLQTESSVEIKNRTIRARAVQRQRFNSTTVHTNAQMSSAEIKKFCGLDEGSNELLKKALEKLGLSARAHDKIIKVARTIADLGGCENIETPHIAESIGYRALDRT